MLTRRPKTVQPSSLTTSQEWTPGPTRQPRRGPAHVDANAVLAIPAFYAAISTVAGIVAALPVVDRDGQVVDTTPDGHGFFNMPTHHDTWFSFVDSIMWNLCIHGNAFGAFTDVDMMGLPLRTEVIHPSYVTPHYSRYTTFEQQYWLNGEMLSAQDLMHYKAATQGGYAWGISPLKHLATAIAIQVSEISHVGRVYEDGAKMTGFLSSPMELDPDVASEAANTVAEAIGGRGAGIVALTHGMTWNQVALNHHDLELLAARQWSSTEAAMIVGVPPHLIGAATYDGETYSSVQQDLQLFARLRLMRWRHAISGTLALHGLPVMLADTTLTKPTRPELMAMVKLGIEAGVMDAAEGRVELGLPPRAEMPAPPPADPDAPVDVPDDIRELTG